jgi:hypothetical protein
MRRPGLTSLIQSALAAAFAAAAALGFLALCAQTIPDSPGTERPGFRKPEPNPAAPATATNSLQPASQRAGAAGAPSLPPERKPLAFLDVFGARLGAAPPPAVRDRLDRLGLSCRDASPRSLLAARAADDAASDAVTGASARAARARVSPQVRLSCEGALPPRLDQGRRVAAARGRLLFVFDDPDAPLRHVAFQRRHRDADAAAADLEETVRALERRFGAPAPAPGSGAEPLLPLYEPRRYGWRLGCVEAEVTAVRLGPETFALSEKIGVRPGAACSG